LRAGDPGVVHQDGHRPERVGGPLDHPGDLLGNRHVSLDGDGLAAHTHDLGTDGLGIRRAGLIVDGYLGAGLSQRQGHGLADPAAGPGHRGDLAVEQP